MRTRRLGRSGLTVSAVGFGCGAIGGLMVRGEAEDQVRAAARAVELGINYFDTAPLYGDGASEQNLGRVLEQLEAEVIVGTKVRLGPDRSDLKGQVVASVEASLSRLGRDRVDLVHLHNSITEGGSGLAISVSQLGEVLEAFEALKRDGKIGACGLTAHGETQPTHQAVATGRFDTAQVFYNLLNPSAARPAPGGFYAQDFACLLDALAAQDMGALAVRVVAAGALSQEPAHPLAPANIAPFGSGPDAETDRRLARRFAALVVGGAASNLQELALRFVLSHPGVGVALLGFSSLHQVETACTAAEKGPLPPEVLDEIGRIQDQMTDRQPA